MTTGVNSGRARSHLKRAGTAVIPARDSDPTEAITLDDKPGNPAQWWVGSAEKAAWDRGRRPKTCKLALQPKLAQMITRKLLLEWSPEQIAGWLKRQYSDDERYHVSHETIYKSLFIQARGALKKELLSCLRTQRITRRPRHASLKGKGLGKIADAVTIRCTSVIQRVRGSEARTRTPTGC